MLLLLVLVLIAGFSWLVFGGVALVNRGQKKSEANSEQILDEAFDGSPDVTFKINMQSVKYETVILGAKKRGYKLVHQADNQYGPHTLIFEKSGNSGDGSF